MAFAQPGPGRQPLSPQQQTTLASALRGQAAPSNPQTPAQRTDPKHDWLIGLQRARITIKDLIDQHIDNQDPATQNLVLSMHAAIDKLLAGIPPQMIAILAAASIVKPFDAQIASTLEMRAMQMSQPPIVPGAPAMQPPPGGPMAQPTAGAGMPPMGGAPSPVSPGNFPGQS